MNRGYAELVPVVWALLVGTDVGVNKRKIISRKNAEA